MTPSRWAAAVGALLLVTAATAYGYHSREVARRDAYFQERSAQAPESVRDLGLLPEVLSESSGLAVSRAHPGTFWTLNDSGGGPVLYALDSTLAIVADVTVEGVPATDWEALDIGSCPVADAGPWCLYIGDTGDNARRREAVTVHVVPEPDPAAAPGPLRPVASVRFTYDAGPLDAEALAVAPGGDVVIATKGRAPTMWVYTIPAAELGRSRTEPLVLTGGVPLPIEPDLSLGRWLTGGAFDAEGTVLALRTYTEVYFYSWPLTPDAAQAAPVCALGPMEPVGEAIAFAPDGRILLSSESMGRRRGHVLEIECTGIGG